MKYKKVINAKWDTGFRETYYFENKNKLGESLIVGLTGENNYLGLEELKRQGVIPKKQQTVLFAEATNRNTEGANYQNYNPQLKATYITNFEWVLENTEDNKKTLLKEIYKRFMEAVIEKKEGEHIQVIDTEVYK